MFVTHLKELRKNLFAFMIYMGEPSSSVAIMSGYRLDHLAIEVRFPAEAKGVFL
jgi:hypothetical protein